MNGELRIVEVEWCTPSYQESLELRHRVLREPIGLQFTAAELDAEMNDRHFGGWLNDELVAVVSVRPVAGDVVRLRQMAVEPARQRNGLATELLRHVERLLAEAGVREVKLHARESAIGFYQKEGYVSDGETFVEVTLPHQMMTKSLKSPG